MNPADLFSHETNPVRLAPGEVLAAGAKRVCVVSAILNASDVTKACAEFRRLLE